MPIFKRNFQKTTFASKLFKNHEFDHYLPFGCNVVIFKQFHLFRLIQIAEMRQTLRLFRPAPNQNIESPRLWQDPVLGYFETHGKMEFLPGEQYNLTDEQKKAVLWRYRVKEILKKEYLRREFDPHTLKYKQGVVVDPAMFRWYAADMTQSEFFRQTPRAWFLYAGSAILFVWLYTKICIISQEKSKLECSKGNLLWWDRCNGRRLWVAGSAHPTPYYGYDY